MQIAVQIEDGNQSIFNALNAFLKSHKLNYRIEKSTKKIHTMSEEDEADFKETLRLFKNGELKFMSADEMKKRTDKHLAKLKEKYA
ncbi:MULTISPECIES: hypothetical protein [unclassified Campylobacter]|uniref:hypothetical protein n=1 Tax=unclassified Campylobacter TaxID=2593542 RepID=UPI001B5B35F9|nr:MULTISPECIES: hypothetical protein [unclassified Campylobacter]MBP3207050.1 hypothetical protein [Campylobacter sp.]MBR2157308.1 hypothetical protein [Campylobacter sp.]MBR4141768.1 hypothetical protein [Campylobacter sp.]MDA3079699.1 hypothetical protein [Campylobacter sp. CS_NA2]MDA3081541.1 hypothetical protein [Campylobacter sp. CS_NA1]